MDVEQALEEVLREVPAPCVAAAGHNVLRRHLRAWATGPPAPARNHRPQQRRPPRYQVELWNAYDATLRDEQRTSGGWHLRFQVGGTRAGDIARSPQNFTQHRIAE